MRRNLQQKWRRISQRVRRKPANHGALETLNKYPLDKKINQNKKFITSTSENTPEVPIVNIVNSVADLY